MSDKDANIDLMSQSFQQSAALGERALQSDFVMEIEGMEWASPLIRTTQLPDITRGEPVEDQGQYGQMYHQYGPPKRNGQITAMIVELKDGRVEDAIWDIVQNKKYVNVRVYRFGEGHVKKGYIMKHVMISGDPSDGDTTATTVAANRNLTLTYSWCDRI